MWRTPPLPLLSGSFLIRGVISLRVPSTGQIVLFKNNAHSIGPCTKKINLLRHNYTIYIYIYIYIYREREREIFVVGQKRERNILRWVGPWRDLYFFRIYLFILFLHTCIFPACCFRQRTYMAQGLINGILNETWTHSCLQFEWFSDGYGFIWRSLLFFS